MRDLSVSRILIAVVAVTILGASSSYAQVDSWPYRSASRDAGADSTVGLFGGAPEFGPATLLDGGVVIEGTLSPDAYYVGPGDGFLITVWGKRNEHFQSFVTPEGKLLIPQISEIMVGGLTIEELRVRLTEEINKYFFDVRVDATLIQLRQFQVYILGEVARPGGYPARAVDRVSQLVGRSGGLLPDGSARAIQILRGGAVSGHADLIRFNVDGDLEHNPFLRDGDVVLVRHRSAEISVDGSVRVPGRFEFREGDSAGTLVRLSRGFQPDALVSEVELVRFNADQYTTTSTLLDLSDTTSSDWKTPLLPDDRVFVRAKPEWHRSRSVTIEGEVKYPGIYSIEKDSTKLTHVVSLAGGFTDEASLLESYVVRRDTTELEDPEFERLKLTDPSDMTPTEYSYFKMKSRSQSGVMVVDFLRLFRGQDQSEDITLRHGDRIFVTQNRETVLVTGQVAVPGAMTFNAAFGVEDYIERAGGYGWNARKGKTRVIRAKTGEWVWANKVDNLGPGDTIWVPDKPYRDWWSIFFQGLATVGQIATIILVIDTVKSR